MRLYTLIQLVWFVRGNYENVTNVHIENDLEEQEAFTFTSNGVFHSIRPYLNSTGDVIDIFEIRERGISNIKVKGVT